jgi:hypothetical protein
MNKKSTAKKKASAKGKAAAKAVQAKLHPLAELAQIPVEIVASLAATMSKYERSPDECVKRAYELLEAVVTAQRLLINQRRPQLSNSVASTNSSRAVDDVATVLEAFHTRNDAPDWSKFDSDVTTINRIATRDPDTNELTSVPLLTLVQEVCPNKREDEWKPRFKMWMQWHREQEREEWRGHKKINEWREREQRKQWILKNRRTAPKRMTEYEAADILKAWSENGVPVEIAAAFVATFPDWWKGQRSKQTSAAGEKGGKSPRSPRKSSKM